MKITVGHPIKVAGEKWILADVSAQYEDGQTVVFLQLTPYIKEPHLRPVPKKRWTIYIYDEEHPVDPVKQVADAAISLIEDMKAELQQLECRRDAAATGLAEMSRDVNDLKISLNRAQERLRRRVRANPYA